MSEPENTDIQYFSENGTWTRPPGAVRVEVMIKGGDGGCGIAADGSFTPGEEGETVVQTMTAEEAGASVEVVIGAPGRGAERDGIKAPDGKPGYAVVTSYLA